STPYDAKGLLISAVRDNNPVIYVENKAMYHLKGAVPEGDYSVPIGVADVKREGEDVTIVAISRMVGLALEAAADLEAQGVSAEVVDPRSLSPLDTRTILDSVKKTGRLIIVDEDHPRCGMASEIAALAAGEALDYLDGPVERITPPPVHVPFSPGMENFYLPGIRRIVEAALWLARPLQAPARREPAAAYGSPPRKGDG
ncbi:MAG: hypothetical protein FJW37_15070, partial [Acidobacteria bacterium]|nr:hypothetical protein [Acidobacteriota bacterium]